MQRPGDPAPRRRRLGLTAGAAVATLLLSGCGAELRRGYLPEGVTELSPRITSFWTNTWIAALGVGLLMWFLILWCVVAYRRRKDDDGTLPVQFRYNVPLEILYTVVPVLMVAVLFGKTVELQGDMLDTTSEEPDVVVNVIGKKWSWDFNYINENVYVEGQQPSAMDEGEPGTEEELPTMVLPVDSRVEFVLTSRDVIHSFWVPQFLTKMDIIPGRVNRFAVTTTEEGTFQGKCAELCGAYHSQMLFNVEVLSAEGYAQAIADLEASGNSGQLGNDLNLYPFEEGQNQIGVSN